MPFDIRKATANAIERTGDPTAPIKLQEAHKYAASVGKMLAPMCNQLEVQSVSQRLLKDFSDAELDKANPALVMALCGCLVEALILLGRSFADDPTV